MTKKNNESDSWDRTASDAIVLKGKDIDQPGLKEEIETLHENISNVQEEIESVKKEQKSQNIRLVEFLGIFAAIIAFVSISGQALFRELSFNQILLMIPVFGLTLMLFVVGIHSLIVKEDKWRFWLIFILLTIIFLMGAYLGIR